MTGKKTTGRGGARPGAGRPKRLPDCVRTSFYLTHEQISKAKKAGGSAWLRSIIDAVPDGTEPKQTKEAK